jgi:hypothetical protein
MGEGESKEEITKLILHFGLGFTSGDGVLCIGSQEVRVVWEVKGEIRGYMGYGQTSNHAAHVLSSETPVWQGSETSARQGSETPARQGRRLRSW